jgi:hypothetical protein
VTVATEEKAALPRLTGAAAPLVRGAGLQEAFTMIRPALALTAMCQLAALGALHAQDPLFESAAPVTVGAGSGPISLVDIDRDGHLDLLTSHLLTRRIAVLIGDGRGGFTSSPTGALALAFEPGAMAHADLDRDGNVDLVLASRDDDGEYIHVLRGDGRGGFDVGRASRHRVSAAFRFYKPAVAIADVTADTVLDIVTANGRRNRIEILRGDGRGGFTLEPPLTIESGGDFYSFLVGDVDGDPYPDLVTTRDSDDGVGWLAVRRGDAVTRFADAVTPIQVLPRPYIAAIADMNGDGRADLVLRHAELNRLTILSNAGAARGFTLAPGSPIALEHEAFAVLARDVDRDGTMDLLAATVNSRQPPYAATVTVLLGPERRPAAGSPFRSAPGGFQLAAGDVDADGKVDVVASSFEGNAATVLRGR